jgi:hypothetical protein
MPVQDDARERELARTFNLEWNPAHQRGGNDAILEIDVDGQRYRLDVEVKSTTGSSVSTARDFGMDHIQRWRQKLFIIGYYSKARGTPELQSCLCLTPIDMEPWIFEIEEKILIDYMIAQRLAQRTLELADLFAVCGQKDQYTISDAKRVHKRQWSAEQYRDQADIQAARGPRGFSQGKMLELLRLRARYIAERGATLNNPHVPKKHLQTFKGTDRFVADGNWAADLRTLAAAFVRQNPGHPMVRPV